LIIIVSKGLVGIERVQARLIRMNFFELRPKSIFCDAVHITSRLKIYYRYMNIRKADNMDTTQLTLLFNQYRMFYHQPQDLQSCKSFISRRIENKDSTIFVVSIDSQLVGFIQLYASFSSVAMEKLYILNDLFVLENHRQKGVATKLMQRAEEFAKNNQACRLLLETNKGNLFAQKLYVKRGWIKEFNSIYFTYKCRK